MKKIFYVLVAGILTLAACNKDNVREGFSKKDTVTATLPVQSKTTLNALQVVWSADDAISVFAQNGNVITNNEGTISAGVGTTQATFDVIVEGTSKLAAVYPYSPATAYDGTKVSISMADTYAYVEDGIGGAPMASLIKSNAQSAPINFKNAGALMGITVNNIPAGYNQATLTSMGDEAIAGPCEITFDVDGNPSLVATTAATAKVITITYDAAAEPTNKTFYFPIPVGDYSSLQLAIGNGTDVKVLKTKALVAERSIRYKSTLTLDAVTGVIPTEVEGTQAASEALAAGETSLSVTVKEDEADPTIEMAASDATPTLSFESIPAGKTVTIQEGATGAPEEFVVSASSEGNSSNNFAIITPNSTVSLEANAEEVTYNEVLAHTAAQTLIVGKGVTINDLKVKGGNVRVYGEVKAISRTDDNADEVTCIFLEEGGSVPANLGEGFVVIKDESKWDGESSYAPAYDEATKTYTVKNAYELAWVAAYVNKGNTLEGCTIVLGGDIDLNNKNWTPIGYNSNENVGEEPYFAGTFDGNGKTISNLKIELEDKGGVGLFGAVYNATFKNFTLNNVDIKAVESESDPENRSGAQGYKDYIVGGQIGAVAGYDVKAGTLNFENIDVTGLVKIEGEARVAQGQRVGGVFGGRGSSKVNFTDINVVGDEGSYIKGFCTVGGVSGQIQGVTTFTNVHTDIDVYAVTFGAGGVAGVVPYGSSFTNCSSAGDLTLDASSVQPASYSANYFYRIGGIVGTWSENKTAVITLTNCSYTGKLNAYNKEGKSPEVFDYAGYVGRGYTLTNCAGSKVIVNGKSYVQAANTTFGIYVVDDVYEIATLAAFKWFANEVNSGRDFFTGKTVALANDIDLNGEEWTPIGSINQDSGFCGNFDGRNKTIKNLKITEAPVSDDYAYVGLFGITENNTIKNLVVENVNISTKGQIAAAVIAYPYYTVVENVTVKGDVNIEGTNYVAGILAYTRRCYEAKDLTIAANSGSKITGDYTVGGVISDIQINQGGVANYSNFKASGLTITANKMHVGGISGIIAGQTLDGATVENVTIVCDDARKGIVSGSLGKTSVIKNISVKNVTGATDVVGATYDKGLKTIVANGDVYEALTPVSTADELIAALEAGAGVYLLNDIKIDPAAMSNAYGKTGINVKKGQTIDGGGHTLDIKGAGGTWDSGINTTGGLIKNITVTGSFRGIFINHNSDHSEKVVLDNVTLTGVTYTISCDQGVYQGIEATNCTFNGWTSFAKTAGNAKFVKCNFGEGNGYKYCRPYSDTEFVNCTFCPGYAVDTTRAKVTFTDCTFEE